MERTYDDVLVTNDQTYYLTDAIEELRENGLDHTADMLVEMSKMIDALMLIVAYDQGGNLVDEEDYNRYLNTF